MTPGEPAFLWAKTGDESAYYWLCQACEASGDIDRGNRSGAEAHVTHTGHTVTIHCDHRTTMEGVNTRAGADHM